MSDKNFSLQSAIIFPSRADSARPKHLLLEFIAINITPSRMTTLELVKVLHADEDLIYRIFKMHSGFLRNLNSNL
jgi:hypothetical protein